MRLTKSKARIIIAAVFFALSCVVFVMIPETRFPSGKEVYSALNLTLPVLVLFYAGCLLFDGTSRGRVRETAARAILLVLCLFTLFYAVGLLGGGNFWNVLSNNPYANLYGFGIVFAAWLVVYGVIGGASWALRIATLFFALFGYVSYYVQLFRSEPFVPMDVSGAQTALFVLPGYTFRLTPKLAMSALLFLGVLLVAFKVRALTPVLREQRRARIAALVLGIGFFAATTNQWFFKRFNMEASLFSQQTSIQQNGALVNFVANIPLLILPTPEGYSPEAARAIAFEFESDAAAPAPEEAPDVIVILGESWAELAPKGLVETNLPVMPYLDSFKNKKDAFFGKLRVSVKGGQTSCSEFEFLAGTNLQYGMYTAPFLAHVNQPMPALPALFKQMGYDTYALHNGRKAAWGRDKAFPLLGFDAFYDMTDMEYPDNQRLRNYLRDSVLYRKALSVLKEESDKPKFLYLITIQTHGGYDNPHYKSPVQVVKPEGEFPLAEQYLGLMRQSDGDFTEFMKQIEKRKRPTIVLVFGDHLPAVEWQYWAAALIPTEHDAWEYTTFYIVWSNFSAPVNKLAAFPCFSLGYLGVYLTELAGLPLTGYQKFLREGAKTMPALIPKGVYDDLGNFYPMDLARTQPAFREQAIMQHNLINGVDPDMREFYYLQPPPEESIP